jgi:hypothetical protein
MVLFKEGGPSSEENSHISEFADLTAIFRKLTIPLKNTHFPEFLRFSISF